VGPLTAVRLRVVFDTNLLVSRYLSPRGTPARLFALWESGAFIPLVSAAILAEYGRVLRYPRLRGRHHLSDEEIDSLIHDIGQQAILVEPRQIVDAVPADESDNRFLECAIAGGADYIVSGDNHLLALGSYEGVRIVRAADFLLALGEPP
jgi:putative PIN family toxin of toxin-antitoxin system